MPFKITSPPPHAEKDPDKYLPIARTCFFTLSLPKYSSTEVSNGISWLDSSFQLCAVGLSAEAPLRDPQHGADGRRLH